jgi:nucleoside-diphosphate-sugar epimerase
METVLITGACGNIGRKLRPHLAGQYRLRLTDRDARGDEGIEVVDLSQSVEALVKLFEGVAAVVHLAADPNDRESWHGLVGPNLDALNNTFAACILAKVPRIVFASSNHVMGGYKDVEGDGRWLTTVLPPKPGTRYEWPLGTHHDSTPYGSMKLFGERLGLCYAQATGGVFIGVRIGWVNSLGENRPQDLPREAIGWFKRMWLSTGDMCRLMELAVSSEQAPGSFHLVNGMSDNAAMPWDIEHTFRVLGWRPKDGLTLDFKDKNLVQV